MTCDICGFVENADNSIIETKRWIVLLASDQAYLGRCYITLKRHCGDLTKIKKDEWLGFFEILKRLEKAITKAFNPDLFNLTCLMNLAYQNSPPNPHVHWHLRPRYKNKVKFNGLTFVDPEFGHHYAREHERSMEVDQSIQNEIINRIKAI